MKLKQWEPVQSFVQECLDYDPHTGRITNKLTGHTYIRHHPKDGYRRIQLKIDSQTKAHFLGHRLAFLYVNGWLPREVDHINGNRQDDRICNLRAADHQKNAMNHGRCHGEIPLPGVSIERRKKTRIYRARIKLRGKSYHIGYYDTEQQAYKAYLKRRRQLFGEWSREVTE